MIEYLKNLVVQSVSAPREAAANILALQLGRTDVLWMMVLASVLNSIAFFVTLLVTTSGQTDALLPFLSPFSMTIVVFGLLLASSALLHRIGAFLGGQARFTQVLALVTWLQYLRFLLQIVGLVLMLVLPGLATTALILFGVYGIWILLNFLTIANGFESNLKSLAVLVISFFALSMIFSVLLSAIGINFAT